MTLPESERIRQALTHKSAPGVSYERLEWLGDAILGAVVTATLYTERPDLPPGELTLARATVVNQRSLAEAARALGLSEQLQLGDNERKLGRHREPKLLSDAFEAVVGAIFLDSGYHAAAEFVQKALAEVIAHATPKKSAKNVLMEHLQARGQGTPLYEVQHATLDSVTVVARGPGGTILGVGTGRSQSEAETAAAEDALARV